MSTFSLPLQFNYTNRFKILFNVDDVPLSISEKAAADRSTSTVEGNENMIEMLETYSKMEYAQLPDIYYD